MAGEMERAVAPMATELDMRHRVVPLVLIGCVFLIMLGAWSTKYPYIIKAIGSFIYDFQTLIGALLALAGAWWGVSAIRKQIHQTEDLERRRISSKKEAARAVLPLTLSSITGYERELIGSLRMLHQQYNGQRFKPDAIVPSLPDFPYDVISSLKETIEFSTSVEVEIFARLLSNIQVCEARVRSMFSSIEGSPHSRRSELRANVEEYMLNAMVIHKRAESIFDYARRETSSIPIDISWQDVESAMVGMLLLGEQFQGLRQLINRRSQGDSSKLVD